MCCGCPVDITRLLWFDGVEGKRGKRGLTLTVSFLLVLFLCVWGRAGWGVKLFDCIVRTGVHGILCA